ncbi:hypothetical protein DD563_05700 [Pelagicola sp. LXJ1103]|nr:hypothetical protein DD563_05700 [Pelagicola sp. LXJ1103]
MSAFLAIYLAGSVLATEVNLTAPGASEGFTDRLKSASLSIQSAADGNAAPQDLLAAAQADYNRLIGVLYAAGYYGPVISIKVDGREAGSVPPLGAPSQVNRIDITVDQGAPFTFSRAEVTPLAPGTKLPEEFRTGAQARGDLVQNAADASVAAWRDAGHAKVAVTGQKITALHPQSALSAQITLAPGPRLTFGALNIPGESRVRDARIREIAGLPTGEIYDPAKLKRSADRLRRSGAFRSVALKDAEDIGPGDRLDINAELADARRRRVGVGIELSSLEGLGLSAFWLHRNLLGGAERLRFDIEVGGIGGNSGGEDYSLGVRFERPATFTPDTGLYLGATISEESEPEYRERKVEVGGGFTHIFSDELEGELGIGYRYSEIDDAFGSRTIEQLFAPAELRWDTRDDPLDANRGFYIGLDTTAFLGLSGGGNGTRVFADARAYRTIGAEDGLTFAARAQLGTVAGASTADVPPGLLFFSGGPDTVRGQPYQSLAITLPGGQRVGGRSFLGFSGEIRADINDTFQIVAFADTGFIGGDALGEGVGDWHSGAGLGGRYNTGLGPIRIDLATPLDGDAGQDFEIYIGIGQAF